MPYIAETAEHYEANFEAFLAANPQFAALDDAAIFNAMPLQDAVTTQQPLDFELPF